MGPTLFRITLPGDLATPDSSQGRQIIFYLSRGTGALYGNVASPPPAASGLQGRVSYWVELRKQ